MLTQVYILPGSFKWRANINNVKKHSLSFVCTVEDKQISNQAMVKTRNAEVGIGVSEERKGRQRFMFAFSILYFCWKDQPVHWFQTF